MPGIWPAVGVNQLMDVFFKEATPPDIYLGLFYNDGDPPEADTVLADLTEPTTGGYARIAIPPADFTLTAGTGQITAAAKTFTPSGDDWGTIDGWFICDAASGDGVLIAIEQFSDGPYNVLDTVPVIVIAALNAS
ncbi:MAG: hypothetical protein WC356_02285 [Candidatus Micrarchaeia archaeon]|jgi:hypothetical protein